MTDELRAAAELRAELMRQPNCQMQTPHQFLDQIIIRHLKDFAHQQPGNDEPVTEEWLRSIGFHEADTNGWLAIWFTDADGTQTPLERSPDGKFQLDNAVTLTARTRGDVRRLCAALSVDTESDA